MASKLALFAGLLVAVFLLITSEVAARDLAETTTTVAASKEGANANPNEGEFLENAQYYGGYGRYPRYGGYGRYPRYGGYGGYPRYGGYGGYPRYGGGYYGGYPRHGGYPRYGGGYPGGWN